MKTLLILRHAKSSWKNELLSDHDRPLKERGKRDAAKIGCLIREKDLEPELIISSTAKRARKTAELVAEACGYQGKLIMASSFYHGDPNAYIKLLRHLKQDHGHDYQRVMVVGHNPGLEELLNILSGALEWMPTATLAQIDLPIEQWKKLQLLSKGKLANLWVPRALA